MTAECAFLVLSVPAPPSQLTVPSLGVIPFVVVSPAVVLRHLVRLLVRLLVLCGLPAANAIAYSNSSEWFAATEPSEMSDRCVPHPNCSLSASFFCVLFITTFSMGFTCPYCMGFPYRTVKLGLACLLQTSGGQLWKAWHHNNTQDHNKTSQISQNITNITNHQDRKPKKPKYTQTQTHNITKHDKHHNSIDIQTSYRSTTITNCHAKKLPLWICKFEI